MAFIIPQTKEMKQPTPLWQAVSIAVTLLIAIVTGWVTLNNKVSRIEARQEQERINTDFVRMTMDKKIDKLDDKIDQQGKDIRQILIEIQNKQDRKR